MNAYLVYIPDPKDKSKCEVRMESYYGGYEPPEPCGIIDVVIAETPSQAKAEMIMTYATQINFPLWNDDWNLLRVRLLEKDVTEKRMALGWKNKTKNYDRYWSRVHEVLDHNNKPCNCPEARYNMETNEWEDINE